MDNCLGNFLEELVRKFVKYFLVEWIAGKNSRGILVIIPVNILEGMPGEICEWKFPNKSLWNSSKNSWKIHGDFSGAISLRFLGKYDRKFLEKKEGRVILVIISGEISWRDFWGYFRKNFSKNSLWTLWRMSSGISGEIHRRKCPSVILNKSIKQFCLQ